MSLVIITTVFRVSIQMRANSSCKVARVSASRALNGSSIRSTLGSIAKPRATATRWRMPPESSRGTFFIAAPRLTKLI